MLAEQLAEASAWTDVQDSAPAAAAAAAECTPLVTRRSVRFADTVQAGSNGRAPLRHGTPYSAAAWAAEDEDEQSAASSASPVVGSCRRSPLGFLPAASPAAASTAAAAWRRSPLGPMQSAAKPAADQAPMRRFAFGRDEDDSGSSSSDEDDNQVRGRVCDENVRWGWGLRRQGNAAGGNQPFNETAPHSIPTPTHLQLRFDASRMGQRANQAASPSPLRLPASTGGATPMAHPEPPFGGEEEEAEEGYGSYGGVRRGGSTTPGASMLSTSSFSPPQPLVMMAVRPLGRVSLGAGVLPCCCSILPWPAVPAAHSPCLSAGPHSLPSPLAAVAPWRHDEGRQHGAATQRGRGAGVPAACSCPQHPHLTLLQPPHWLRRACRWWMGASRSLPSVLCTRVSCAVIPLCYLKGTTPWVWFILTVSPPIVGVC